MITYPSKDCHHVPETHCDDCWVEYVNPSGKVVKVHMSTYNAMLAPKNRAWPKPDEENGL